MKFYSSGEDLAKDMGVALEVIEQTHEEHYQAAKKTETQPDAGPWPAYPSGKSWDEAKITWVCGMLGLMLALACLWGFGG